MWNTSCGRGSLRRSTEPHARGQGRGGVADRCTVARLPPHTPSSGAAPWAARSGAAPRRVRAHAAALRRDMAPGPGSFPSGSIVPPPGRQNSSSRASAARGRGRLDSDSLSPWFTVDRDETRRTSARSPVDTRYPVNESSLARFVFLFFQQNSKRPAREECGRRAAPRPRGPRRPAAHTPPLYIDSNTQLGILDAARVGEQTASVNDQKQNVDSGDNDVNE